MMKLQSVRSTGAMTDISPEPQPADERIAVACRRLEASLAADAELSIDDLLQEFAGDDREQALCRLIGVKLKWSLQNNRPIPPVDSYIERYPVHEVAVRQTYEEVISFLTKTHPPDTSGQAGAEIERPPPPPDMRNHVQWIGQKRSSESI